MSFDVFILYAIILSNLLNAVSLFQSFELPDMQLYHMHITLLTFFSLLFNFTNLLPQTFPKRCCLN